MVMAQNLFGFANDVDLSKRWIPRSMILVIGALTTLVFIYLLYFSRKLIVYTYVFIIHGAMNIIDGGNSVGAMFFILAIAFLYRSGRTKSIISRTTVLSSSILVLALATQLRFGIAYAARSCMNITLIVFAFGIIASLFRQDDKGFLFEKRTRHFDFTTLGFKKRDCDFIQSVLNNEKYESIAARHNISVSTVKLRMTAIYKKLDVPCKDAFLVTYSHAHIHYPDFLQEDTEPPIEDMTSPVKDVTCLPRSVSAIR